jgi:hypothetical protein
MSEVQQHEGTENEERKTAEVPADAEVHTEQTTTTRKNGETPHTEHTETTTRNAERESGG